MASIRELRIQAAAELLLQRGTQAERRAALRERFGYSDRTAQRDLLEAARRIREHLRDETPAIIARSLRDLEAFAQEARHRALAGKGNPAWAACYLKCMTILLRAVGAFDGEWRARAGADEEPDQLVVVLPSRGGEYQGLEPQEEAAG